MAIEFDPEKDARNREKHGMSLKRAEDFGMETALIVEDDRKDYGEVRYRALGRIGRKIHAFVFTYRDANVRAISLRPAVKEEREIYELHRP